ncbi:MAG: amidohydrolase [Chloroflexi bacterium]|nr:amidohydrolase [Chloroflexota bacterium]
MRCKVDALLYNARIITLDPARPSAEAVAVEQGRILWVGENADIVGLEAEQHLDCQGLTLLPGFHDAHLHFFAFASSVSELDLSDASSLTNLLALVQGRAQTTPPGRWVLGQGYHEFHLKEKRHPTRRELDQVAPGHPIRLAHSTHHAWVLNSQALALAGISQDYEPPDVGHVERDEAGEPTGLILEPHIHAEALTPLSAAEQKDMAREATQLLLGRGITSFQDATAGNGLAHWREFQRLKAEGEMPCRATVMMGWEALDELLSQGLQPRAEEGGLRLGPIKIMQDEASPTLQPPQAELDAIVLATHRAGFQIAIHAVEEPAVAAAVSALGKAQKAYPRPDPRHRIEHASQCPPHLQERLHRLGAVVVSQPPFLYASGDRYLETVPPEGQPWLYPFGSLLKAGVTLAASSDAPIAPPNPFLGIYSAATRHSRMGQSLSLQERISPQQALSMYTLGAAHSIFRESELGSLTPGKLADFILVDRDPTETPSEELKDIRVMKTFIGGKLAWEA